MASTLVHAVIIISACHILDTYRACRLSTSSQEIQARDHAYDARFHHAMRLRTHQIATANSPTASASTMPASIPWKGQKRPAG